jgi:CheY-like chemotaxis protein
VPARSVAAARTALDAMRPAAIILDLRLQGDDAWDLLTSIKRSPATASIPVIVVSTLADRDKGIALGADAYAIKPADRDWLLQTLDRAILRDRRLRVLHIDDEEAARFVVRGLLQDDRYVVREAQSGADGLAMIASESPDVIVLDLRLGDMTGLDLLERLRGGGVRLPTVVLTSQTNPDGGGGADCACRRAVQGAAHSR